MGLLAPVRRFLRRMGESDEQRYAEEIEAWAAKVPGTVPIREGLNLGTRLVVDGLLAEHQSELRIVNPTFEFAA